MKTYNTREFIAVLKRNGFEFVRNNCGHNIYKNGNTTISVPRRINKMIAQRLIKENCLVVGQEGRVDIMIVYDASKFIELEDEFAYEKYVGRKFGEGERKEGIDYEWVGEKPNLKCICPYDGIEVNSVDYLSRGSETMDEEHYIQRSCYDGYSEDKYLIRKGFDATYVTEDEYIHDMKIIKKYGFYDLKYTYYYKNNPNYCYGYTLDKEDIIKKTKIHIDMENKYQEEKEKIIAKSKGKAPNPEDYSRYYNVDSRVAFWIIISIVFMFFNGGWIMWFVSIPHIVFLISKSLNVHGTLSFNQFVNRNEQNRSNAH